MDFPFDTPLQAWAAWYGDAFDAEPRVPDAMQIATVDGDGAPTVRTVLAKDVDEGGVVFYTNLKSRKGQDLAGDSRIAALFHWKSLERQVHVEGRVRPVRRDEADRYFASRPRGSQIGAWASAQSQQVDSRETLEAEVESLVQHYEGREIPRPPYWSGFRIVPHRWEFWQGRADRLHDRIEFLPDAAGWVKRRLQP